MPPPYGQGFPLGSPRIVGGDQGHGKPAANARGYGSTPEDSILIAVNGSGLTGQELARSEDGGESWVALAGPNSPFDLYAGCFDTNRRRLFVGADTWGAGDRGWYSDDYGDSWVQSAGIGGIWLGRPIYNEAVDEVWSLGNFAGDLYVSRSIDGGANWTWNFGFVSGAAGNGSTLAANGSMYCTSTDSRAPRTPNGILASFTASFLHPSADILYIEDFGAFFGTVGPDIKRDVSGDGPYTNIATITAGSPQLAYSPARGVAVCLSNNDQRNSSDGLVWANPGGAPALDARRVIWSRIHSRFLAVGATASDCFRSATGVGWTAGALPPSAAAWTDIIECPL